MGKAESKDDPYYRYTREEVQVKHEGKKTIIPNFRTIAKQLKCDEFYLLKFFQHKLGTTARHDEENDKYIINGNHDLASIEACLQNFVNVFILCPVCNYPETILCLKRDEKTREKRVYHNCKSCHALKPIKHSFCEVILKNK